MAPFTTDQIVAELNRYGGNLYPDSVMESWDLIDSLVKKRAPIRLPTGIAEIDPDLHRLFTRTNYARTIVNSTVNMVLASGVRIRDTEGVDVTPDRARDLPWPMFMLRRLLRFMSQYGAAWKLVRPHDPLPIRVYKPHAAREIHLETDPDTVKAVLHIAEVEKRGTIDDIGSKYLLARWYEHIGNRVHRRVFLSEGGFDWAEDTTQTAITNFMPLQLVRNRDFDGYDIFEASDVWDASDLIRIIDEMTTKFAKAMEDEAFRMTFFANVSPEQFNTMRDASALNVFFAKNGEGYAEPRPYWANPADHRQYLDAFKSLVNRVATVSRTSSMEFEERPMQDIPAQTLRIHYGPQIARCQEIAEFASTALSEDLRLLPGGKDWDELVLEPRLPVSEDKVHQNAKGLLDSGAYSRREVLIATGHTTAEADRISREAIEEKVELEARLAMAQAKADALVVAARPATQKGTAD